MTEPIYGVGKPTPVVLVGTDGNTYVAGSGAGSASAAKQDEQTAVLNTIASASLPDKETPTMLYRVKVGQSFTGASAGDPIIGILTINTVSNTFVSNTPLWYNGNTKLPLVDADVDTSKLEVVAANTLTASELAALTLSVGATARVCVSQQPITVPITTGVTLASLCSGGIIPVGAVTCEIQSLNAVILYSLDASAITNTSITFRLNVEEKVPIDSALASVTVVAEFGAADCSVAFFDRV